MKRITIVFLILFVSVLDVFSQDRSQILKVYNWDDYIDETIIEEFESWYQERTGEEIHVLYQTFESDFQALTSIELGHDDWDVLTISTGHLAKAIRKELFKKIDKSVLEETGTEDWTKLVAPYYRALFNAISPNNVEMFDYVLPLSVGTTGIIYNSEVYSSDEVNTWNILHDSKFKDKILLVGERDDVFSIATSALNADDVASGKMLVGELTYKYGHEDVVKAEKWLKEAKPQIVGWDTNFGYSYLIQERFPILISWNSNAISAIRESEEIDGPNLRYVIPKEGTYITCDCLVIPRYSVNTKAAVYWINFMCKPENVILNMAASNMISPVADSLIFESMQDEEKFPETIDVSYMFPECVGSDAAHMDPTVYIDSKVMSNSYILGDVSQNIEEISNMFSRIQSNEPSVSMLVFELLVVLSLIAFTIYSKWKARNKMRTYRDILQRMSSNKEVE